jgi:DNA-binding GntR family transcriptional regulator
MSAIRPLLSKRAYVYESLRADILNGQRASGERLVIDDLATQFGVSPIPVREALHQLQSDGLVTIEPYLGAHVSVIHAGLIEEVFLLLEAYEVISSRLACVRMSEEDFTALGQMLQRMDSQLVDVEAWSISNVQLHRFLVECAGLTLLPPRMEAVLDHWQRFRRCYLHEVFLRRIAQAQQDHWNIYASLRTRNPDAVERAIRCHNRMALADYLTYLTQQGHLQPSDMTYMRQESA